jgi:GTP-binding protein
MAISALTHQNLRPLLGRIYQMVQAAPEPQVERPAPVVIRPNLEDEMFEVGQVAPGTWLVRGGKIERAVQRTPTKYHEALLRLHNYLDHEGVIDALRVAGIEEGDTVRIDDYELEWVDTEY